MTRFQLVVVVVAVCCLVTGCGYPTTKLNGKYDLELFPDGQLYFVVDAKHDSDEGGVFGGSVEKLGFSDDWILAYVGKNVFKAFTDNHGWYALNTKDGHVVGPIPEAEIKNNPIWSAIKLRDAQVVFQGVAK